MQARIRKTGEIINIADYAKIDLDVCDSYGNPISVSPEEIELIQEQTDTIDWKQRRYEVAKAAMQGLLANTEALNHNVVERYRATFQADVAHSAVKYADALIEELKKK